MPIELKFVRKPRWGLFALGLHWGMLRWRILWFRNSSMLDMWWRMSYMFQSNCWWLLRLCGFTLIQSSLIMHSNSVPRSPIPWHIFFPIQLLTMPWNLLQLYRPFGKRMHRVPPPLRRKVQQVLEMHWFIGIQVPNRQWGLHRGLRGWCPSNLPIRMRRWQPGGWRWMFKWMQTRIRIRLQWTIKFSVHLQCPSKS